MANRFSSIVISCEHASNAVPAKWRTAFRGTGVLKTHRAWDPGAAVLAHELADALKAPAFFGEVTRLLVDLNRSDNHRKVFSEFTPHAARNELLATYWHSYRNQVRRAIQRTLKHGSMLHVSVHSFTPVLDGETRNADIGLLYDPARKLERDFCAAWRKQLRTALPTMRVRMNYPYRGTSDGCTTAMRKLFGPRYAGMEIEINQSVCGGAASRWAPVRRAIIAAVARVLD
jgi:predicted N-formylglutamate amidohydrolase